MFIQLCRHLPTHQKSALFVDSFFTSAKLFKALKTMNFGACGTATTGSGMSEQLIRIRSAATKEKDRGKTDLMTSEAKKPRSLIEGDVLCMVWIDMNTVQYMTTMHSIDKIKSVELKPAERRHDIPESANQRDENGIAKLSLPIVINKYNNHMGGSDGNAQRRSY